MKDDYNPFDEENVNRQRKLFTLVIAFIIASCIAFYVFHTYDVFPQEEKEQYSAPLEWYVIPHNVTDNDFDIVVHAYFNITDIKMESWY